MVSWTGFIERCSAADHGVQVYTDAREVASSVARFLEHGARDGAPAVVIATPEHRRPIAAHLDEGTAALVTYLDASATLASIMDGDRPSAERFEDVIGGVVDDLAARFPGRTVRAFGEMVDLLWRDGREEAAIELEELWNALQQSRPLALLCAYHLDVFDVDVQARALPAIFGAHTHAQPVADTARLGAAVDAALAETVGPAEAARIYLDVAAGVPLGRVPRGHAVLAWLAQHDAATAGAVLARARVHYAAA